MMFSNVIFFVATNVSCGSFLLNHSCFEVPIISYFSSSILRSLCVGCEFSSMLPSQSRKRNFSMYFDLLGEPKVEVLFVEVVIE